MPSTRTVERAGGADVRVVDDPRVRGRARRPRGRGPAGRGSTRRRTLSSGPEGGSASLSAREDRRALHRLAQLARLAPPACRATAPNPHASSSASAASSSGAADPVEQRRQRSPRRAPAAPRLRPSRATARKAPSRTPVSTATSGAYADSAPSAEQRRPDPRAERRAADEAGQRQRARDQAPLVADRGERDHEEDDADVDETQAFSRRGAAWRASNFASGRRKRHYLVRHGLRVAPGTGRGPQR